MKTPEEILKEHSPKPDAGYKNSWVVGAMKEYAKQWVVQTSLQLNVAPRWEACMGSIIDKINEQ